MEEQNAGTNAKDDRVVDVISVGLAVAAVNTGMTLATGAILESLLCIHRLEGIGVFPPPTEWIKVQQLPLQALSMVTWNGNDN